MLAALWSLSGCSTVRPSDGERRHCATYSESLAAPFASQCAACHTGATAAGGFDVTSYLTVLGSDGAARLLVALDPAGADAIHQPFVTLLPTVREWMGQCQLAYQPSVVHPPGILNPADPDFHANLVRELAYDLPKCAECHGADFAGGKSGQSCRGCHEQGPTACDTCHGQPPATGAHLAHTSGPTLGKRLACAECHVVPTLYTDVGHLFLADGTVDQAPAEVTFGGFAGGSLDPTRRSGPPAWDGTRCTNVYCHGGAFGDSAATVPVPMWKGGEGAAKCGGCHGVPPANHAQSGCVRCHARVVDATGAIRDQALHLDGKLSLGDDSGTCLACHPSPGGAHAAHTQALHGVRGPIGCAECHNVPQAVGSPGHIDHPEGAVVFPAGSGAIARAGGAQASFDRPSGRCADVWCHGGGSPLANDTATTVQRLPDWNGGAGPAACGGCHGVPPKDATHASNPTLLQCAQCHGLSIDATGAFVPGGGHLNGVIDGS